MFVSSNILNLIYHSHIQLLSYHTNYHSHKHGSVFFSTLLSITLTLKKNSIFFPLIFIFHFLLLHSDETEQQQQTTMEGVASIALLPNGSISGHFIHLPHSTCYGLHGTGNSLIQPCFSCFDIV